MRPWAATKGVPRWVGSKRGGGRAGGRAAPLHQCMSICPRPSSHPTPTIACSKFVMPYKCESQKQGCDWCASATKCGGCINQSREPVDGRCDLPPKPCRVGEDNCLQVGHMARCQLELRPPNPFCQSAKQSPPLPRSCSALACSACRARLDLSPSTAAASAAVSSLAVHGWWREGAYCARGRCFCPCHHCVAPPALAVQTRSSARPRRTAATGEQGARLCDPWQHEVWPIPCAHTLARPRLQVRLRDRVRRVHRWLQARQRPVHQARADLRQRRQWMLEVLGAV